MIRLENVSRRYETDGRTVAALDGLSLSLERGEEVAVVGSSGSGKTTLLNLLGLLLTPDEGRYLLAGKDVSSFSSARRASSAARCSLRWDVVSSIPAIRLVISSTADAAALRSI